VPTTARGRDLLKYVVERKTWSVLLLRLILKRSETFSMNPKNMSIRVSLSLQTAFIVVFVTCTLPLTAEPAAADSVSTVDPGLLRSSEHAADYAGDGAYSPPLRFMHTLLFTVLPLQTVSDNQLFLGGSYRLGIPEYDAGLMVAFTARTEKAWTLEPIRPRFFMQREEGFRGTISLSIDKVQMFSKIVGAYAAVGAGYSWGTYKGTEEGSESAWSTVVDVGGITRFGVKKGFIPLRIGYQYMDRVTSDNHAMFIGVGWGI
jgi:hypothetical protein